MCIVVNRRKTQEDVYIGRGSIWGNPFVLNLELERDLVVEQYKLHLIEQIKQGIITIDQLKQLNGKKLGCYCKPKKCHGDIIKEIVDLVMSDSFDIDLYLNNSSHLKTLF